MFGSMSTDSLVCDFPIWGLLPKKETGVTQFLSKYPEYDGRGIVIAIFDSGVDPGAAGLQKTSDGKVKVIERFDCSGSGDVDTSTVVQAKDGEITGLTGRKLKIPDTWKNPTGNYHIGVKNAFEMYPSKLLERIEKERKEKEWDPSHKTSVADCSRKLQDYDVKTSGNSLNPLDKLVKEDMEARLEVLNSLEKKFKDHGPCYDCVLFHDGDTWLACLDTTEKGDLGQATLLREYSINQEYATLTKEDQLNYSINVHNDGNILEIVSVCSAHGTHVASIASAYFPNEPEKNGVAPGAQIVSLSLGDNRLGTMETGTAVVRAMVMVMRQTKDRPIHVINMSYGEHAHWSCSGRIGELMAEVVGKHNVTWIASAGNLGPALCTIGTPPDISTNSIIGVGAYVSPEMMVAEYSLREKLPGMPYTWTSRGPTIDGDPGVTVCAPGSAITSVPTYTLRCSQLMNGTSMAAPHVAGAVAVLLSGLKQRGLAHSPHSVRRALENTAQFQDSLDRFAQGCGLLQVERAFEYLCQFSGAPERDVRFSVQCGVSNSKGIHMRSGLQEKAKDYSVNVEPVFHENSEHATKIGFNMKLVLVCSESWVQAPTHLDLMNMSRMFSIRIDPTTLPVGVHSSRAYDSTCPDKGPVFRIPITVVKPQTVAEDQQAELAFTGVPFSPNTIRRHFVLVPEKATWTVLRLRCTDKDKSGKFILHCLQLLPKQVCKTLEFHKMLNISSNSDVVHSFQCRGGLILEVVVAKYWANLGDIVLDYSIEFHGVKPDHPAVTMQAADGVHVVSLSSGLRLEEVQPTVTLKNLVVVVRPSDSKIAALSPVRDAVPPGRQIYENVLTYNVHVGKATELVPNCPMFSEYLYESEFESQLWMLFDCNKHLVACGDAYPSKYMAKVEKGDYVLKMHVRHEKRELLDKVSDLPMLLSLKLPSPISLDVFVSQSQAMVGGKKMGGATVPPGSHILPLYIGPLSSEKLNKGVTTGQYLSGTISYAKDELGKRVDVYPFKYVLLEPTKKNKNNDKDKEKEKDREKTKFEEYAEALRDLKVSWLAKLEPGEEATALYEELKSAFPEHLPTYTAMLQSLEPTDLKRPGVLPYVSKVLEAKEREDLSETCRQVIQVADVIISSVDAPQLLAYAGMKTDTRPDAGKIKAQMDKQKTALVEACCRKGCALARMYYMETMLVDGDDMGDSHDPKSSNTHLQAINNIWREVMKFADASDPKISSFLMWHAAVLQHYGRLAKLLLKLQEDKLVREVDEKLIEVYRKLGWRHCEAFLSSWLPVKYPAAYHPF